MRIDDMRPARVVFGSAGGVVAEASDVIDPPRFLGKDGCVCLMGLVGPSSIPPCEVFRPWSGEHWPPDEVRLFRRDADTCGLVVETRSSSASMSARISWYCDGTVRRCWSWLVTAVDGSWYWVWVSNFNSFIGAAVLVAFEDEAVFFSLSSSSWNVFHF
jgi:hypothetical protein